MKNINNQIRQLLKEALLEFQKLALSRFANAAVNKVQQAIDLLPCETCNGTRIKWSGHTHNRHRIICPDCEHESD